MKAIQDIIQSVKDLKQTFEYMTECSVVDCCNGIISKLKNLQKDIQEEKKVEKANKELIEKNYKLTL